MGLLVERKQGDHSHQVRTRHMISFTSSIQTYVVRCMCTPLVAISITLPSLMITLERHGYIASSTRMKPSKFF